MLFTLIIFGQNKKYKQNKLALRKQIIALLVGLIAILFVQIYCLRHEPWHDFRPWYKGNFIAAETYSKHLKWILFSSIKIRQTMR